MLKFPAFINAGTICENMTGSMDVTLWLVFTVLWKQTEQI